MDSEKLLVVLRVDFQTLETGLNGLQTKYKTLSTKNGRQTSESLQESLSSLFKVIIYVNRNDTSLVNWHGRSDNLKTALRYVGVDRRTDVLVEKKTVKIKTKVAKVEAKFVKAHDTVSQGLDSMHLLSKDMITFSSSTVTEVSTKVIAASDTCDRDSRTIQRQITREQKDHDAAQGKATKFSSAIERSKAAQDITKDNKEWHSGVTRAGLFGTMATVAGSVIFPPALFVTAPLLVATAASAYLEGDYKEKLETLERQETEFKTEMQQIQGKIDGLKAQLSASGSQNQKIMQAKKEMEGLQTRASTVGREIDSILKDLRAIRVGLSSITAKLQAISKELHECGYAQTRRQIAVRLRGTLELIDGVASKRDVVLKKSDAQKAAKALLGMTQRTDEVLKIMGVA